MGTATRPVRRLARRSLRKARFFAESSKYRELLQRHPDHALSYSPRGQWLIADTKSRLSMSQVMHANLQLVAPLLRADGVEFFFVPSVSENRIRLGVLESHSDRVLDALLVAYDGQPIYFDVFTETEEHREVLADDLADVLRRAGRVLLIRVYRAYVWPNNAFWADALHATEVEFWSATDSEWTAPFGNRVAMAIPVPLTTRATVNVGGEAYPTIAAFADQSHADLLDFPVDLVFPLPALPESADRPGLRRALRSVWMHSEGFRHVYVAVDREPPRWLDPSHPQLQVVIAADLPRHSSLDPRLATVDIDGLSDRYVLLGDNVMLRRPFRPSDCFHANGLARLWSDRGQLVAPDAPAVRAVVRPDPVVGGEQLIAAVTGGPLLDRALDLPQCMISPVVRELVDLVEKEGGEVASLDPFDAQYFAFASGLAVGASLRHEVIDATSPMLPRMLRRAGVATSVSTLAGVEPAGEARTVLDRWYPAPSPFERATEPAS